ncbi:Lrp/AsnC family transcriptional regulator [Kiloniella majae]|uniref:Lrp/AsnC family transcriptional regulator n=1 Tax=Kiloniella majae TaxID=1938558 RepID=UPI000A277BA6|nr:Lrp/AsnC family transcriptional regulator [Kiloniella majae]
MSKIVLDTADIRILAAVQQNGQLSKSRLAEIVNLSPTPCWVRLGRLKKAGLIRGYSANIALDYVVNLSKVIVTISLANHRKQDFERFETYINGEDDVIECIATGGGTDYVMKIVSKDLSSFQEMMDAMLSAELGIDRYMTYIVTREVKSISPNLTRLLPVQKN